MVKTKPIDLVVRKWKDRASIATEDYKAGVLNPRREWEEGAKSANDAWKAGIQDAIARDAYVKGVEGKNEKWKRKASTVGATRYAQGVAAGVDEYKAKMSKVLSIIGAIELPPRGPRGAEQNYERVKAIGKALHEARKRGEI
ncbi:MAG: hypothetical protein J7J51_05240 [Candidatus Omnitrophica bacterium]|nr:hypothetical protein [Candidatus Omnitrophota bacterium]